MVGKTYSRSSESAAVGPIFVTLIKILPFYGVERRLALSSHGHCPCTLIE